MNMYFIIAPPAFIPSCKKISDVINTGEYNTERNINKYYWLNDRLNYYYLIASEPQISIDTTIFRCCGAKQQTNL